MKNETKVTVTNIEGGYAGGPDNFVVWVAKQQEALDSSHPMNRDAFHVKSSVRSLRNGVGAPDGICIVRGDAFGTSRPWNPT